MPDRKHQYSDSGYSSSKDVNMARQGSNSYQAFYVHGGDSYNHRTSGQFSVDYHDTGSSVSRLDSVADAFNHSMAFSIDDAIDPRLNGPSDPAGFAGDNFLPFVGQSDQVSMDHITQRSPVQGPHGAESTLNLSSQDATGSHPWSSLQLNNNTMNSSLYPPSPNQPSKRRRLENNNGPSPRSQDQTTFSHFSSSPTRSMPPHLVSTVQQDPFYSMAPPYPNGVQSPYDASSVQILEHNQQSAITSPSQRGQPQQGHNLARGNKQSRSKDKKYACSQCKSPEKVFATTNDLDRHMRTVHSQIKPGSQVWKCSIAGCTVPEKLWARQDNFKQHVVRMHGEQHKEAVENMCVIYDPNIHGHGDSGKGKRAPGSRHSNAQELHSSLASGSTSNTINMGSHKSPSLGIPSNNRPRAHTQHHRSPYPNTDRLSMTNHPASRGFTARNASASISISSADPSSLLQHNTSSFLYPDQGLYSQPASRQRITTDRHTLANPETHLRQRREIQEQDSTSPYLHSVGEADAEFGYVGQVTEDNIHAATVSPAELSKYEAVPTDAAYGIQLESPKTLAMDNSFRTLIDKLPEDLRSQVFKHWYPETLEELGSASTSERSVLKKGSKGKQADAIKAQKLLNCSMKIKVNGKEQSCGKQFDKQSELRKHEKRHAKTYGCTFDHCYKRFGTKWEWKRHEHNQHVQLESWRCRQWGRSPNHRCAQLFQEKEDFRAHIRTQHPNIDERQIDGELRECHLSKKWLGSFWCGFCAEIIQSTASFGPEMDKERNEHVSKHIDGRLPRTYDICEWEELEGRGKTKEQMKVADKQASLKDNDTKMPPSDESEDEDDEDDELAQGIESGPIETSPRPESTMGTTAGRADRQLLAAHNAHDRKKSSPNRPAFQLEVTTPSIEERFTAPQQHPQYCEQQQEQQQQTNGIYPGELDYGGWDF